MCKYPFWPEFGNQFHPPDGGSINQYGSLQKPPRDCDSWSNRYRKIKVGDRNWSCSKWRNHKHGFNAGVNYLFCNCVFKYVLFGSLFQLSCRLETSHSIDWFWKIMICESPMQWINHWSFGLSLWTLMIDFIMSN